MDFDKFAQLGGYKNKETARVCWRPIFNKLKSVAAVKDGETPTTPHGTKRKAGSAESGGPGSDRAATSTTPTRAKSGGKARVTPASAPATKPRGSGFTQEDVDDDDDNINVLATPTKKPSTGKSRAARTGTKKSQFASAYDTQGTLESVFDSAADPTGVSPAVEAKKGSSKANKEDKQANMDVRDEDIDEEFRTQYSFMVKDEDYLGGEA